MLNKQENRSLIIIGSILWFLVGFILAPILSYWVGWLIGKIIELFLGNSIIHTLTIFGVTILPEQIPSICAILQLLGSFFKTSYIHDFFVPDFYDDEEDET